MKSLLLPLRNFSFNKSKRTVILIVLAVFAVLSALVARTPVAQHKTPPSPAGVTVCATPPANMVSWWPAEGNTHDIVSHNNGTLTGGTGFASGEVGQAFTFDGSSGKITIPDSAASHPSDFTYDAWIAVDPSSPSGDNYIICKGATPGQYYPLIFIQGTTGHHFWRVSVNGSASDLFGPADSVSYTFQHIAVTRQGDVGKLYIDGNLVDTQTVGTGTGEGYPLAFGNISNYNAGYFKGKLDEVEFFNRALDATEIAAIFNAGSSGKCRTCYAPPPNMIGWWPGDGNTKDIQSGNNGLLINGATFGTGEVGKSFSLDGADYVDMGTPADLNITGNQVTLDGWINPSVAMSSEAWFFGKVGDGATQYALEWESGQLVARINAAGFPATFTPAANSWTHLALVYNGAANPSLVVYVNGDVLFTSSTPTGNLTSYPSSPFRIGAFSDGVRNFTGLVDEVEVFNRALSADEIQNIFDAGSLGKCKPTCVTPPPGLTHWWPGDNTATDIQGNNNGTLQNGATFANGKVDRAFSLNSNSSQYVDVGKVDLPDTFTIDAWINPNDHTSAPMIVSNDDGNNGYDFFVGADGSLLLQIRAGGNTTVYETGSSAVGNGAWQHVAVSYNANLPAGSRAVFFVNANVVPGSPTQENATAPGSSTTSAKIGVYAGNVAANAFNGRIDELEMFNRVLDPTEIAAIYNAGSAGKCKTVRFYVSNEFNYSIEKLDADGNDLGTFALTGRRPHGLSFDPSGNLYVADTFANVFNGDIERFDPLGNLTQTITDNVFQPFDVKWGPDGFLYASNLGNYYIQKFDSNGNGSSFASSGLTTPTGLAFDSSGFLYVADRDGNKIVEFDSGGNGTVFASSGVSKPLGLAFDISGNLYVANRGDGRIKKFDSAGNGSTFGNLSQPRGLAFDLSGNLYAASSSVYVLEKFAPDGTDLGVFASSGLSGPAFIATQLLSPTAACIQFDKPSYSVDETGGSITLTVTRNGDVSGSPTVHYQTFDGTGGSPAVAGADYTETHGDLNFGSQTSMTFQVPIIADDDSDPGSEPPSKTFTVTLSNATGAMLSGPATATVTINDIHYTISVAVSGTNQGGGTTSGEGGTISGAGTYDNGAQVDLVATPNDCFTFTNWTDGVTVVSTDPHLTFTAGADRNLVANFTIKAGCAGSCNAFATATIANVSSEYPGREAVHVVDGSGLDSNNPPNHDIDPTHMWMNGGDGNVGSSGADPDYPAQLGHITFNLNGTFSVSSFRVWNYNENTNFAYSNRGVNTLKISTSIDGVNFTPQVNPATNTTIWTFDAAPTSPTYTGQVITFPTPLTAAFIRFDILTNHGNDPQDNVDHRFVGLSEIRFNMCPISCVPPPANMIAWWKGDGNANDSISGNNGSLMGNATFATGEVGEGFSFDGVAGHVTVASPVANFGTGDFTIDFWMQTTASDTQEIINKRLCGDPNSDAFDVRMNGGPLLVELSRNADNTGSFFFSTRSYNDGQFHHIAIVRSGNTLSMYGDGTLDNSITNPNVGATNINNNVPLGIGGGGCSAPGGDGTHTFNGVIDEVELFNRALSADEIAGIVRAGGLGKCECTPPPSGLVSWWPGEGDTNDVQDGNNGTFTGTPAYGSGEVGQAFSFDGASYIQVPDNANLHFTSQFTLDVWINPVSTANTEVILIKQSSGNYSFELDLDAGGSVEADISGDGNSANRDTLISDPGVVSAGAWTHVATTFNAGDWKIYVNGVEVKSKTSSVTSVYPGTADFVIASTPGGYFFNGRIDEVEVFNRALGGTEIAAIYHAGSAGKCRSCTPAPTPGMVSWWPGDNNANDIQGNNGGILQGGVTFVPGKVGQAFSFDGSTGDVKIPASQSLNVGAGTGLTIDAWINPADVSAGHPIVEWNNGSIYGAHFWVSGGQASSLFANLFDASGNNIIQSDPGTLMAGTYQHVAVTYDQVSGNAVLYINGTVVAQQNFGSITPQTNYDLFLGERPAPGSPSWYQGTMDEVEIFNRALSQSEIQSIYDAGSGGKCKPPIPTQRQLANISSRADVGTGDNVAIAGFIIQTDAAKTSQVRGPGASKHVLIRGLGPSLTGVGSPTLADPVLDLYNSQGTRIDHNDNWQEEPDGTNNPTRTAAIQATGLAPTNPNEAALLETLSSNNAYTAILSGKSGGTGIGLVEVYDLEATTNTHLHNLSTRAFVSTGDNVLIGGLIVQGDATTRILLRAIGPSLAGSNISNPLPDPVLDLHDANGTIIESNNDWGTSPEAAAISASGLAPTNPKESAILFAPAPGPYTAIMRDRNGNSGVGSIEAYWLGP